MLIGLESTDANYLSAFKQGAYYATRKPGCHAMPYKRMNLCTVCAILLGIYSIALINLCVRCHSQPAPANNKNAAER